VSGQGRRPFAAGPRPVRSFRYWQRSRCPCRR
jgi:hypothetical protein